MKAIFLVLAFFSLTAQAEDFFGTWNIESEQCQMSEEFFGPMMPCDSPTPLSIDITKIENMPDYPTVIKSGIRISIVEAPHSTTEFILHTHTDNRLAWSLNEGVLAFDEKSFTYDFISKTETWGYLGTTTSIERISLKNNVLIIQLTTYSLENNLKAGELNFTPFLGEIAVQNQRRYILKK